MPRHTADRTLVLTEKGKGDGRTNRYGTYVVYDKDYHEVRCLCCHHVIACSFSIPPSYEIVVVLPETAAVKSRGPEVLSPLAH